MNQNDELYGTDILNSQKASNAIKNEATGSWLTSKFDATNWDYQGKSLSLETLQLVEMLTEQIVGGEAEEKAVKKVLKALESISSKTLYKGPS